MTTNSDMIVDVVDIRNRIIGSAKRADVMRKGLNFRTVHVILVDQMGRMVVQILAAHHPRSPGLRGSSVAGYVRSGETYLAAAKRKIVAELNLTTELKAVAEIKMFDQESIKFVGLFPIPRPLAASVPTPDAIPYTVWHSTYASHTTSTSSSSIWYVR
jgi:hypothetical protein